MIISGLLESYHNHFNLPTTSKNVKTILKKNDSVMFSIPS